MTKAESLNLKLYAFILLAILFSIIYLIFVPHTFAQTVGETNAKLKACQAKEGVIKNRLDSLTRLVENQETKFSSIAARVENHYTTKLVPKGEVLSNYLVLLADIMAKKTAVDQDLATAKTDAANFSCTNSPKVQLNTFRTDMQTVKSALKAYRTSIRNLIVALMTLKSSPTPGGTPK